MATLLQVNVSANYGAHGRIAEDIGRLVISKGWRSVIAYGRQANLSQNELIKIGSSWSVKEHALESRVFDNHGLASRDATRIFVKKVKELNPDIIHLHNIHGYYLNYKILFDFLLSRKVPVIWTLHDCWPFTGHCAYFDYAGCDRWESGCHAPCPCKENYPKSSFWDASKYNYKIKKETFSSLPNLTLVPVSEWLGGFLNKSFLSKYPIQVIHNGIDLSVFHVTDSFSIKEKYGIGQNRYILGVASEWVKRKGYDDFLRIAESLHDMKIVMVGVEKKKMSELQSRKIIAIPRTESANELSALYSGAEMFLNLTYEDNYPTTNLEAMACGTPVLTYRTGGSPESVSSNTGWVVEKGNIDKVITIVKENSIKSKEMSNRCRNRAETYFENNSCFEAYYKLYERLLYKKEH